MADPIKYARWLSGIRRAGLARRDPNSLTYRYAAEYRSWNAMVQRCTNPKLRWYKNYGGRGIQVAPAWRGRGGFARFFAEVGPKPSSAHSLDRIDNAGHYEPSNVRWATRAEQSLNSRKVRMITIKGETRHLAEWARLVGIAPPAFAWRVRSGWSDDRLLQPPLRTGA